MKLKTPKCPHCGRSAIGASDWVPGCALFDGDPAAGPVEYAGETRIFHDDQLNAKDMPGQQPTPDESDGAAMIVQCSNGHEWPTQIEEAE